MAKAKKPSAAQIAKMVKTATNASKKAIARSVPACAAFLFCDKIITGDDKTASIIRVIDTVGVPPDESRKIGDACEIGGVMQFISLKKGDAKRDKKILVSCTDPTGRLTMIGGFLLSKKTEPQAGMNVVNPLRVRWGGEGIYWMELATDDGEPIAKSPLRVLVAGPGELLKKIEQSK